MGTLPSSDYILEMNGEFVLRGNSKLRLNEMYYQTLHDGIHVA